MSKTASVVFGRSCDETGKAGKIVSNEKIQGKAKRKAAAKTSGDLPLRVSIGYATAAAEEISGDTAISCGLPDGSLALILSDGMGKGIRAAADSRMLVRRLRRNLKSGMQPSKAIKEVNSYMIAHESDEKAESFATLDLLIIDRRGGKAKFYKMGAASSFLVRGGTVRSFEKAALPIGIIPQLRLTRLAVNLQKGDIVLMVSDGITEADLSDLSANWLVETLHKIFATRDAVNDKILKERQINIAEADPRKLAKYILDEALARYGSREKDDLTIAVIRV